MFKICQDSLSYLNQSQSAQEGEDKRKTDSLLKQGNHQREIGKGNNISKTNEAGGSAGISDHDFDAEKTLDETLGVSSNWSTDREDDLTTALF